MMSKNSIFILIYFYTNVISILKPFKNDNSSFLGDENGYFVLDISYKLTSTSMYLANFVSIPLLTLNIKA